MTVSNILGCTGSIFFLTIPFFWPLLPLPFLYYFRKLGPKEGIKVCLAALLIVGTAITLMGFPFVVKVCIGCGIIGYTLSRLYIREYPYSYTILWGSITTLSVILGLLIIKSNAPGETPIEMIIKNLKIVIIDPFIKALEAGGNSPEDIEQFKKLGQLYIEQVKKEYLAILVVTSGLVTWLNVVLSKPIFLSRGIKYPDLGRGDSWRAPERLIWIVIAAGFSWLFSIKSLEFAAINALSILKAIYTFHGLSILLFFFKKYNVPKLTRVFTYLLIIFQPLLQFTLAVTGLFDQWIDFRKIHSKAQTTE